MQSENSLPIFDYLEACKLRDAGIQLASLADSDWLDRARAVSKHLAMKQGECDVEMIYQIIGLPSHPNVAGSIFRGKEWQCVGIRQANRTSRHAGTIRTWRLK